MHIYVDPDFTSADQDRIRLFQMNSKDWKINKSGFAFEFTVQDDLIVRYRLFEDSVATAQAARG